MKTSRPRRLVFITGLVLVAMPAAVMGAELRVVGSDLLGADFSKALYDFAGAHQFTLALALDGSRPGLDQLKAGRADVALLSLPREEEISPAAYRFIELAYHRIVVLVPQAAPLRQISCDQLGGIFGAGAPMAIMRWSDLGVGGEWAGSSIAPHVPAAGVGVTSEFFRHTVLQGREFRSHIDRYETLAEVGSRLAGESRGIALAAASLAKPGIAKMVPVSLRGQDPAYLPTPENLVTGDYPLRLPLRLVVRRETTPSMSPLNPFLRFLLSDELAMQFERAGLVALPAAARRQQILALEKP